MKVLFYTLGCKVNQYETEAIREQFILNGYDCGEDDGAADVVVINSCTVTAESDRKTRQTVRRFRHTYPFAVILLTGCMPQAFPQAAAELLEADIVVGNTAPADIPNIVNEFLLCGERIVRIGNHKRGETYNTPKISNFKEHTRAFMKIQDGCERYCTYCIIPSARGPVRSKSIEDIVSETAALAKSGFCEIVLVGINLSAYGVDTGKNLCDAVDAVCGVEGIKRVRLGSLEPDHISDEMLMRFASHKEFCPQFHLSLQSGCDRTLARMNRHYDSAFYYDLITRIRRVFDNAAITTDIMVGFPDETEQDFNDSVNFALKVGFAKTHVFAYSRRQGTVADGLPNQITKAEKERRSKQMIEATLKAEKEFLSSQTGKTVTVLFETVTDGVYEGYSKNYTLVKCKSDTDLCGKLLTGKITDSFDTYCLFTPEI